MIKNYKPGLHILSTFSCQDTRLKAIDACRSFFNALIAELDLHKVGEVYHEFDNGGFTAVICLTESHMSIHTWPEFELATFDVFLSNFDNDNTAKARTIYQHTISFFEAIETNKQEVMR